MYNHLRDIPSAYYPFTKGDVSLKELTLFGSFFQFSLLAFKLKISCTYSHFTFITLVIMTFLEFFASCVKACIGEVVEFLALGTQCAISKPRASRTIQTSDVNGLGSGRIHHGPLSIPGVSEP